MQEVPNFLLECNVNLTEGSTRWSFSPLILFFKKYKVWTKHYVWFFAWLPLPFVIQKIFKKPQIKSGLWQFMNKNIDTLTKMSLHLKFSSTNTNNVMPLYVSYDCSVDYLHTPRKCWKLQIDYKHKIYLKIFLHSIENIVLIFLNNFGIPS